MGSPKRGITLERGIIICTISSRVNRSTRAFALSTDGAVVSHTVLFLSGPVSQVRKISDSGVEAGEGNDDEALSQRTGHCGLRWLNVMMKSDISIDVLIYTPARQFTARNATSEPGVRHSRSLGAGDEYVGKQTAKNKGESGTAIRSTVRTTPRATENRELLNNYAPTLWTAATQCYGTHEPRFHICAKMQAVVPTDHITENNL